MKGKNSDKKSGSDKLIKFRPSPNFKNMKKFLKHRSDTETSPTSIEGVSSPYLENKGKSSSQLQTRAPKIATQTQAMAQPRSQPQTRSQTQKLEQQKEDKPVQPPLPPYPPPPDSPSILMMNIKKEKLDDDEPNNESIDDGLDQAMREAHGEALCIKKSPAEMATQNSEQAESFNKEPHIKKTICKEFIRGNCKRPVCKYAHEIDVSQLEGVFTFCWNYQNAVCTYPNCRFVHASVFEQEEFFKTGILPSHTRKHLMKQQGPPEGTQTSVAPVFGNPPPLVHPGVEKGVAPSIAVGTKEEKPPTDDFRVALPCSSSPLKREWSDAFSSSPCDHERKESLPKKCDSCDTMKFRQQYNKEKVDNMTLSNEELRKKIALLDKKTNKLSQVLMALIRPTLENESNALAAMERDKTIFNSTNSTWANLMSRLLAYPSSGDQSVLGNTREA